MNGMDDISNIVGDNFLIDWINLDPKIFYKDGKPYGLIGTIVKDNITHIASTVTNIEQNYTIGMIKYIKTLYNNGKICLISGSPSRHELLKQAFSRYNFKYEHKGDIMYAYGDNNV